jgi:hypothetical protein
MVVKEKEKKKKGEEKLEFVQDSKKILLKKVLIHTHVLFALENF